MLPDHHRYNFIFDALARIQNYNDMDDARNEIEADIYTSDLTGWLHSRNDRLGYVDEIIGENGNIETLADALSWGQCRERQEVFDSVLQSLEERLQEKKVY